MTVGSSSVSVCSLSLSFYIYIRRFKYATPAATINSIRLSAKYLQASSRRRGYGSHLSSSIPGRHIGSPRHDSLCLNVHIGWLTGRCRFGVSCCRRSCCRLFRLFVLFVLSFQSWWRPPMKRLSRRSVLDSAGPKLAQSFGWTTN